MNKNKIVKLLVASSAIVGGIGLSANTVQATENDNSIKTDGLSKNTTKVSLHTFGKVTNVKSNLRVRVDAGDNYDTIGYVCNNQDVEILSEKGDWYRISFEGREGYVSKKYINLENSKEQLTTVDESSSKDDASTSRKNGKVVNVNSILNIRQSAALDSAILGTLKNGDTFEIISKNGEWYNIKSHNIVGFIDANYVQEISGNETTIENVIQTMTESYEAEKCESSVSHEPGVVVNVTSNLRVRNGASASAEIIGYLLNGQTVSIKGESSGWYNIDFNGHNGYVSKEYVKKGDSQISTASVEARTSGTGKVVNISSHLNIRSGAGTNHSIVGTLSNGATVNILGKSGSWYHISHNGVNGYVSGEYIQEVSGGSSSSESTESAASGTGKVVNISSHLNIRSGAGTNHSIVGTLSNGATVNILGKSGSWYHISHNGVNGYVSGEYIQEISGGSSSSESTESAASGTGKVVNISSHLNIRSGAGTNHSIVGTLSNGATVNILGKSGSWYHISHNGVNGYVSGEYIQEVSGGSSSSGSTESAASGTGKVVNISSYLNIRSGAGTNHSIVGTLSNGATVNILGKSGSWYHISHNGVNGYVSGEYIQEISGESISSESISSGKGQVYNVTSNLRVRSAPSTHSSVLGYLLNGQIVDIIGSSNGWVHINYNGSTGYVSAEYIRSVDDNVSTDSSSTFAQVYNIMVQHLGSPYVWGGSGEYLTTSSLNALKAAFPVQAAAGLYNRAAQYVDQGYRAFDCSGLMQWGFRQVGIHLGRTTYDQINNGYEVSLSSLKPGDLLFYSDLGHVGMYIGNGQWIESPNSSSNVRIANVPWSKVTRARRVIG